MYGGDEVGAMVVDIGASTVKAGYAGEDCPKAIFPSCVGVVVTGREGVIGEGQQGIEEGGEGRRTCCYVGSQALSYRRDDVDIVTPLHEGLVNDWDVMEQLLDHALRVRLSVAPEEHPILLAESSFNTRPLREKACELLFEKFNTPAVFISKNAVLSAFASGRASALVLDSGGGVTTAVPVHEGYVLQKNLRKTFFAGDAMTDCLLEYMEDQAHLTIRPRYSFLRKETMPGSGEFTNIVREFPRTTKSYHRYCQREIARDVKESVLRVADIAGIEHNMSLSQIPVVPYELPDGSPVEMGLDRFKLPEIFFGKTPFDFIPEHKHPPPIHEMVFNSITSCDVDVRKELFGGIVVVGGNTLFPGFVDRLSNELQMLVPQVFKVKVIAASQAPERKNSVWIGGSIFASLGSFQQMWFSKQEYGEHGSKLVERKCP